MPRSQYGQLINFAVDIDSALDLSQTVWHAAKTGDTCRTIAAQFGHPELAQVIAKLNHIRSPNWKLKPNKRYRVPKSLVQTRHFDVLADDASPLIKGGYAKLQVVDRPANIGYDQFLGYDPVVMDVPVQFLSMHGFKTQEQVEADIQVLEGLAGRGVHSNHGSGPPPTIRVSTTDNYGAVVPLVPFNYQWNIGNSTRAPLWRVADIQWDGNPERFESGYRKRQTAVVTLWETTPFTFIQRSVAGRAKARAGQRRVGP